MDDNNGCGCYLILMGIGLLGWIVSGISEDNSGRSSKSTPATQTSTPYIPSYNYTPTIKALQQTEPVKYRSGTKTPDDAYDEGYAEGYEQGKQDARNGYSHGANYDDSNSYYDYYETKYQEGYESGYDEGYSEGKSQYYDEDESDEEESDEEE